MSITLSNLEIYLEIFVLDWKIVPSGDLWELQHRDPVKREWHQFYLAPSVDECRAAYRTYKEGETPDGNGVWP